MRYTLEGYTNSYEIREEIDKTQRITQLTMREG